MTIAKLYEYTVCPFCWKVKAILDFKGIPYERIEVNPMNKKEIAFSADYKKVPIYITETGEQINDSTPIMRSVDQEGQVFDGSEKEGKWLTWSNDVFVKALVPLVYQSIGDSIRAFDYITKSSVFTPFQRLYIKYSGAFVMWMVAKKRKVENPEEYFQKCLQEWVSAIGDNAYLGGEKPNGADLAVWGILRSVKDLPAFEQVLKNERALKWFNLIQSQMVQTATV